MADLARRPIADQLALETPFVTGPGLAIALHEPICQALVSQVDEDPGFEAAARGVLGFDLPREPNRIAGEGVATTALWLTPRRWLVVAEEPGAAGLAARLDAALASAGGFVSDVTHGRAIFFLSGPAARDLVVMGCALEIGTALLPGRCARTDFASLHALIHAHGTGYRLSVDRVFARHMADWLIEAATAVG